MDAIYLDNNATTQTAAEVVAAMQPYWRDQYGNASSIHRMGQAARHAVENARQQVAELIGARPREIIFTSGGTESDNLAILGTLAAHPTRRHVVTTAVEHAAVYDLCKRLVSQDVRVTFVGVDADGRLDLEALSAAIDGDAALVSVMHANNETGVIFPIDRVAELTAARGVPLHVDAVPAVGKIAVDVKALGGDLLSLSAHKIHGPKGAGALYVAPRTRLRSLLAGGRQERDLRPGTENVPAIVGFGVAARLARDKILPSAPAVAALRDRLEAEIRRHVGCARVLGDRGGRLPNTACIAFERLSGEAVLIGLSERGVCASSGSACSSGSLEPSHVLHAMGVPQALAHGAVRFSLSHETTEQEIDRAVAAVVETVRRLEALNPVG